MTVTLHLTPEIEASLQAQAQTTGMSIEAYLLTVLESAVLPVSQQSPVAEERASAFEAWSSRHRPTPLLSDYAVSRESFYEGRDS